MMTPLHPGASLAIANMIGPVFYGLLGMAIGGLVVAWLYHIRMWWKDRREDREPSEYAFGWELAMRRELDRTEGRE